MAERHCLYNYCMQQRRPAFTLIELLVVISIIGILAALVVTQLGDSRRKARNAQAQSDIVEMGKAVESFRNDDIAADQVISNPSATIDQQGGGRNDFPSLFTGTQSVSSLTYAASVSKTPGPAYIYRYVASGTQTGQAGRQLVKGAVNQPAYALCTTLIGAATPYFCATDSSGGGGTQSDQALAAQGLGNLSAAATNGLAAWYKMDESGTAAVASDSSTNGNNGTLINFSFDGTTNGWVNGRFGKALLFNGSNNYVSIPNSSSLDITSDITLNAWVKTVSTSSQPVIDDLYSSGFNSYSLWVGGATSGKVSWYSSGWKESNTSVNDGNWHFVTETVASNHLSFYIDGRLDPNSYTVNSLVVSNNNKAIGTRSDVSPTFKFSGSIDDVRVYNRALSASEVQQLYQGTL